MAPLVEYVKLLILALSLGFSGPAGPEGGPRALIEAWAEGGPAASAPRLAARPDFRLPEKAVLCGEALDLKKRSVYERLELEFLRAVNQPAQVALWQRRAAVYFPFIEAQLKAAGLPDDLKYLAVAESDLRPEVISPAGALGLWQFMPATAARFGLTVNNKIDQRRLPETLMGAAEGYFKFLYGKFGNWALVMAAYNSGENRLSRAIAAQGVRDYYQLDLPRETERYVYRIAAIKVIMENAPQYGLTAAIPAGRYRPAKFTEKRINLEKAAAWGSLARQYGCDYKELRLLNPHILQSPISGSFTLRLPAKT
jgi:hypothetical protein